MQTLTDFPIQTLSVKKKVKFFKEKNSYSINKSRQNCSLTPRNQTIPFNYANDPREIYRRNTLAATKNNTQYHQQHITPSRTSPYVTNSHNYKDPGYIACDPDYHTQTNIISDDENLQNMVVLNGRQISKCHNLPGNTINQNYEQDIDEGFINNSSGSECYEMEVSSNPVPPVKCKTSHKPTVSPELGINGLNLAKNYYNCMARPPITTLSCNSYSPRLTPSPQAPSRKPAGSKKSFRSNSIKIKRNSLTKILQSHRGQNTQRRYVQKNKNRSAYSNINIKRPKNNSNTSSSSNKSGDSDRQTLRTPTDITSTDSKRKSILKNSNNSDSEKSTSEPAKRSPIQVVRFKNTTTTLSTKKYKNGMDKIKFIQNLITMKKISKDKSILKNTQDSIIKAGVTCVNSLDKLDSREGQPQIPATSQDSRSPLPVGSNSTSTTMFNSFLCNNLSRNASSVGQNTCSQTVTQSSNLINNLNNQLHNQKKPSYQVKLNDVLDNKSHMSTTCQTNTLSKTHSRPHSHLSRALENKLNKVNSKLSKLTGDSKTNRIISLNTTNTSVADTGYNSDATIYDTKQNLNLDAITEHSYTPSTILSSRDKLSTEQTVTQKSNRNNTYLQPREAQTRQTSPESESPTANTRSATVKRNISFVKVSETNVTKKNSIKSIQNPANYRACNLKNQNTYSKYCL